jgi:hypothetical protein
LELTEERLPALAIVSTEGKKYLLQGEITAAKILAHYEAFTGGKATIELRSEPVPASQPEGGIVVK